MTEDPGGVFTVMIQLGSILAVMWLYRAKIIRIVVGLPSDPDARHFALMIFVAFLPAVFAGALLADYVTRVLYESPKVFATTFLLGGIVMLVVERYRPVPTVLDADRTPIARALAIGACQVLAMIPGVSRSGATIVGGMLMGLDRAAAAEFSFFLAMPTMTAAFVHSLLKVRHHLAPERALEIGDRLRHGVRRFGARGAAVSRGRAPGRLRAVRVVSNCSTAIALFAAIAARWV